MSEYKEFTGKSLDDAIKEACDFYALERSKLEIEIISGGSSGIFGLVGKKKAVIKARPRVAQPLAGKPMPSGRKAERVEEPRAEQRPEPQAEAPAEAEARPAQRPEPKAEGRSESRQGRGRRSRHKKAPRPEFKPEDYSPGEESEEAETEAQAAPALERQAPRAMRAAPAATGAADMEADLADDLDEDFGEEIQEAEEKPLDKPELEALLRKTVSLLIAPIVGQAQITLTQAPDRVRVRITDTSEEDSGLLIGRDGQTINAVQYLANRVVSKQWSEPVRVQIDTGNYRERQDDKLRKMAYFLAGKAKSTGRAQSTKPLTSYHRRVIHLALQSDPSVQTRSKGEGPLKRVLILPTRRGGKLGNGNGRGRGGNGNGETNSSQQD